MTPCACGSVECCPCGSHRHPRWHADGFGCVECGWRLWPLPLGMVAVKEDAS